MVKDILKIRIQNEMDILLAQKRAKQLCEYMGMHLASQTKFSTAVSEICRNVYEHVGEGYIYFNYVEEEAAYLEAYVVDHGRGIHDVESLLHRKVDTLVKGAGLVNAQKLVDYFQINSQIDNGTKVRLRNKISRNFPVNQHIINGWKDFFDNHQQVSAYEELKNQNIKLIEATDQLYSKNLEVENQLVQIKRLNRELDQYAYIVSHDLKSPLKNIEGLIQVVLECLDENDIPQAKEYTSMVAERVNFMDRLIQDILSYSKIGRTNIPKKEVNTLHLVQEVVSSIHVPSHLSVEIDPLLPLLYTEEIFLFQIFSNLVSNALRYHDKPKGTIAIGHSVKGEEMVFFVRDDGPGISEQAQKRIFELFESVGTQKDSTGIGLTIVKNIIKQKGSRIWVDSDGSSGTTFFFSWPLSEVVYVTSGV